MPPRKVKGKGKKGKAKKDDKQKDEKKKLNKKQSIMGLLSPDATMTEIMK